MESSKQEYWSRLPCPSPGDLPGPGIEPGSPTLQADSLPFELPGKTLVFIFIYLFFPFLKFIFKWRIMALQYHVGFCHTST